MKKKNGLLRSSFCRWNLLLYSHNYTHYTLNIYNHTNKSNLLTNSPVKTVRKSDLSFFFLHFLAFTLPLLPALLQNHTSFEIHRHIQLNSTHLKVLCSYNNTTGKDITYLQSKKKIEKNSTLNYNHLFI